MVWWNHFKNYKSLPTPGYFPSLFEKLSSWLTILFSNISFVIILSDFKSLPFTHLSRLVPCIVIANHCSPSVTSYLHIRHPSHPLHPVFSAHTFECPNPVSLPPQQDFQDTDPNTLAVSLTSFHVLIFHSS